MRYEVVLTPETFHKFGKSDNQHVCTPMIIPERSMDVAMELLNGIEKALERRYNSVKMEERPKDECELVHRVYTIEEERGKVVVHARIRQPGPECPEIDGNRCTILEYERDIHCIIEAIDGCLEYYT